MKPVFQRYARDKATKLLSNESSFRYLFLLIMFLIREALNYLKKMVGNKEYEELLEFYKEHLLLRSLESVLYWDVNTYMPKAGLEYRAQQFAYLGRKRHELWSQPRLKELLEKLEKNESLNEVQQRNVELVKRQYLRITGLPRDFVSKLSAQSNKTLEIWKKAKQKNDYSLVLPELEKLFELNQEKATYYMELFGINDPYAALVHVNEANVPLDFITQLFNEAKTFLIPLVKKLSANEVDASFLHREVPRETQVKLAHELARFYKYDVFSENNHGRIDEVEHPLTIGCGPQDVRVTVKYHEKKVMNAIGSTCHEIGHALHGLQRNPEFEGQPINYAMSPSFGESQSRFSENIIGMSKEFWTYFYPKFQAITGNTFKDIDLNKFYRAIHQVKPGPIRIESDEVTYGLHIIIRYELEQDLFSGKLTLAEAPQAWNQKYQEYLGVNVKSDREGIMQDLHWYSQYWAYFHGYAIGDYIAAQIAQHMTASIPEWKKQVNNGDYSQIKYWLALNVHYKTGRYDLLELIEQITGAPLTIQPYKQYLEEKYNEFI